MGGHEHGRPVVFRNRAFFVFAWACLALLTYLFGLGAADIGGGGTFGVALSFGRPYGRLRRDRGRRADPVCDPVGCYRAQRKVAARMNAARERIEASQPAPDPSARYARAISFSPWPLLAILAVMEAVAATGLLAR